VDLLLDSHVLLWWEADDRRLSARARAAISDPENKVWVSAATVWELEIKRALGKIDFTADLGVWIAQHRFEPLPITAHHAIRAARLPEHHRDPFDRMLIAQSAAENLVLMTVDARMTPYGIALFPAG
jgi:PIN domain nuclease of toxin-antitoxin system